MPLIVEDGTIVPNANSYIDREFYIAYAASRGVVIEDADAADVDVIKGMDFLETQRFIGRVVFDGNPALWTDVTVPAPDEQPCKWPRIDIYHNDDLPGAILRIPNRLKAAQAQVALDVHNGFDPFVNVAAGQLVISEKIGPISTTYSDARSVTLMPIAMGLLRGLILTGAATYRL